MRRIVLPAGAFAILAAASAFAQPPSAAAASPTAAPGDTAAATRPDPAEAQILEMIRILESASDPAIRKTAMEALLKAGDAAVPHLEARIREKGAGPYLQALRLLVPVAGTGDPPPGADGPGGEPSVGAAKVRGLSAPQIEHYLFTKYEQAVKEYRAGRYAEARDASDAILTLEPRVSFRDHARELRALSVRMLFQAETLGADLVPERPLAELDDKVKVVLRLTSRSLSTIRLGFGEAAGGGAPVPGKVLVASRVTVIDPVAGQTSRERTDVIDLPDDLTIPPGGVWTGSWTLDTSADRSGETGDPSDRFYRAYEISARVFVPKLAVGEGVAPRWLQFTPTLVRVVPKGYAKLAEKPLEALGKAMDRGTVNDVFLCTVLVGSADRDPATEMLIKALKDMKDAAGVEVLLNCLKHLTGQVLPLEKKAWLEWWERKKKSDH